MNRIAKYSALVATVVIGLSAGQALGPADSLPAITRLDDEYLDAARQHTLLLGFAASLVACTVNIFLRIAPFKVLITLSGASALWFTWFEAAEPDFVRHLAGALPDFLFWLLAAAAPVTVLFWLIDRKFRAGKNTGKDVSSGNLEKPRS